MCTPRQIPPEARQQYAIATHLCTRTYIWRSFDRTRDSHESLQTDCTLRARPVKVPVGQNGVSGRQSAVLCILGGECPFARFEPPLMCRRRPDNYLVTTPIPHWAFMNITVSTQIDVSSPGVSSYSQVNDTFVPEVAKLVGGEGAIWAGRFKTLTHFNIVRSP